MSVPRGFFETLDNCDFAAPAFLRGVLLDETQYKNMPPEQTVDLQMPPRWTMYGGPLSTRQEAEQFDHYMPFWAFNNGKIWLSLGTLCIVRNDQIKWPADSSFQWTWVWEPGQPQRVTKVWAGSQYQWKWV